MGGERGILIFPSKHYTTDMRNNLETDFVALKMASQLNYQR